MKIKESKIEYEIGVSDFEHVFKRIPKTQEEYDDFFHYCKRGLDSQIDWSVLMECAKEAME